MRPPSPAMIVSLIALMVALSGTTYAAVQIHGSQIVNGTISTPKLKDGAVTAAKLQRGAVTPAKLRNGAVTPAKLSPAVRRMIARAGIPGPQGAPGPQGVTGPQGATGPVGPAGSIAGVTAGGALSGTFPNPELAAKAVYPEHLAVWPWQSVIVNADDSSVTIDPGQCTNLSNGPTLVTTPSVDAPLGSLLIPVLQEPAELDQSLFLPVTTVTKVTGSGNLLALCNRSSATVTLTERLKVYYYVWAHLGQL